MTRRIKFEQWWKKYQGKSFNAHLGEAAKRVAWAAFKAAAIIALLLACASSASAQTITLTQTAPGPNCHTYGCINTPLSDQELITWCNTGVCQKLQFRGLNYFMTVKQTTNPDGTVTVDLSSATYENNGFGVHTDFARCYRCYVWKDGTLILDKEYVGSGTYLYGWNGSVIVTSGTGQVGLVASTPSFDQTVTLMSGDPTQLQVPASVVIPAGSLDADFTITATPTGLPLQVIPVNVTATFPDGTVATMKVTVGTPPAPTPPDSMLMYPCGSEKIPCKGTLAAEHKPGTCWWDGKGADWKNIRCAPKGQ